MNLTPEQERDYAAYRASKEAIRQSYAPGRFVALYDGRIIADAADFRMLQQELRRIGVDPKTALVVQAGVDYPESVVIL